MSLTTKAGLAVGGVALGYYTLQPAMAAAQKDGSKYGITSINQGANVNTVKVTFKPGQSIYIDDTFTFVDTDSVPSIDGTQTIAEVVDLNTVIINTSFDITKDGSTGTMTLNTNYENQQALLNEQIASGAVDAAAASGGVLGNIFTKFFQGLGISFDLFKKIVIGIVVLIVLRILYGIYSMFRPSKFGRRSARFSARFGRSCRK